MNGDNAMAFQSVLNTAQISVMYLLNSEVVQNVFYAEFGGAYSQGFLQELADAIDARVGVAWVTVQPFEAVYVRTEVRGLTVINDFMATANANAGAGLDASPALPNQVTFSVKQTSLFTGRSARGRCYWIGIPKDKLNPGDENRLVDQYVIDVVNQIDLLRLEINATFNWQAVIVSRITGGVPRADGKTFNWVDTVAVNNVVDTLRGRLPK